jgi:hypothetical protein
MTAQGTTADSDLDDIVQSLTSLCLGIDAALLPPASDDPAGPPTSLVTASVAIGGGWSGAVAVSCSRALAHRVACSMFGTARPISDAEAQGALREVATIIGGNFQSLLESPTHLSVPVVGEGAGPAGGAVPVHRLRFDCDGEVLQVSVLRDAVAPSDDMAAPLAPPDADR